MANEEEELDDYQLISEQLKLNVYYAERRTIDQSYQLCDGSITYLEAWAQLNIPKIDEERARQASEAFERMVDRSRE